MRSMVVLLASVVALLTVAKSESQAGYIFDTSNVTIAGAETPYATLDIVGDTSTGQVTFTMSTSQHNTDLGIVFNDISFNTTLTLGADFELVSATNDGTIGHQNGNQADFGNFSYTVSGTQQNGSGNGNGASARGNPFIFVLQLTDYSQANPTNFAMSSIIDPNDKNFFAAHIYAVDNTGFISSAGQIISPGGNNGGENPAVPAPPTVILALLGLPGFAAAAWARRRRVAVA